jgi:hypothetical protein
MARPRKKPTWVFVCGDHLGCIDENRVLELDSNPDKSLLDELECPAADEVLIALRKSFSLTYPRNPFIDGLQNALSEIRRIGVEALKEMPEVLQELRLPPIPATINDPSVDRVKLFKYSFARTIDLAIKVKYEGRWRPLLKLIEYAPADPLVRTLREVVSDTFAEMHDEDQHEETLKRIRERIWEVLPPFNTVLDDIEIERIAERPPPEDADPVSNESDSEAHDQRTNDANASVSGADRSDS